MVDPTPDFRAAYRAPSDEEIELAKQHFHIIDEVGPPLSSPMPLHIAITYQPKTMPTTNPPRKQVRIPATANHAGIDSAVYEIPWICPVCGGPRGEVFSTISYDGSRRLACDGWKNPCGHVDKYSAVRAEAGDG